MNQTQKRLAWIVVAGVVGVLLLVGLAGREPVPQVSVARVVREKISSTITSNGKVEPIVPHTLRAQSNTFVESVRATEGQSVRAGDVLLKLDAAEARAEVARLRQELIAAEEEIRAGHAGGPPNEVAQLESDLRKSQAEVARLRREREALERLVAKQAATQYELDQTKLALDRAEDELRVLQKRKAELARQAALSIERGTLQAERARAALRAYEERVRQAHVTAPVGGTLYSLPVRPAQYVHVGDLLAEVADLGRVRVRAFVDEPELAWLEKDQEVEITWDAMPGRVWKGRTEQIPKTVVSRGTRSVGEVLCSVENQKLELLPNINVNVRIFVRERANALVVPRGAVRADGSERYVFVEQDGKLHKRAVKLGIAGATKYEILEGLAEGDRVALPGEVDLRDAMAVRAIEQK